MLQKSDILTVAHQAKAVLPLETAKLSEEYFYQSLPLCVIDAVFSIGVKYDSTRAVVTRYCEYTSQRRIRKSADLPNRESQEAISSFCGRSEQSDPVLMAKLVYQNRQRTSTRSGILKAEAVLRFAQVLQSFGIEHLQDVPRTSENTDLVAAIQSIPGQRSGISLYYFWMLAGSNDFVKPDRMVLRFLEAALSRPVDINEAVALLCASIQELGADFPSLTPRLLDHEIWKYQRGNVVV